ncbi:MAG: NAD(P)H-hydrate dehydratase [Proteobacteria bacterium]|nr:NAD(P)H-hydrate dehydratase [Pseudomonadota bacterium]
MTDLPIALYFAKDVKAIDSLALTHISITGYQLMTRAAQSALIVLQERWPNAKTLAVLCGPGNNGGDGLVLARLAKAQGLSVNVYSVGEFSENASPEAKQARSDWLATDDEIIQFRGQAIQADVVVDALLGTGSHFPIQAHFQDAIKTINNSKCPVLSIDLPSGLNADTGAYEDAVKADVTLTFVAMKIGLIMGNALDVVGELVFDNLGVSASIFTQIKPCAWRIEYSDVCHALKPRRLSQHKGDNGHLCIIGGGQTGYSGAVCLAGESALRAGAGLVSAVVAKDSLMLLARAPAELMCYGLNHPKEMQTLLMAATVVILGPGLSQNSWGKKFFQFSVNSNKPMIVDADGLNWLAKYPQKRENWILTPHPGEAARLLNVSTKEIQQDRVSAAKALKQKYGGVIVLKGAGTIVVAENGDLAINGGGFPALATGGTGDILAGLMGSLVAQKLSLSSAATLAVSVHTAAAALESTMGERGMLASDLFLHIRNLLNPQQ